MSTDTHNWNHHMRAKDQIGDVMFAINIASQSSLPAAREYRDALIKDLQDHDPIIVWAVHRVSEIVAIREASYGN
jgi:hypothetical protein